MPEVIDKEISLTRREEQVMELIVQGYTNNEMASELGVSPKTVDSHRSNLMKKLDIHKLAELVRYALERKSGKNGDKIN